MKIDLTHLDGPRRGQTEVRPETLLVFGSSPGADIQYPEGGAVAPEHARIRYKAEACSFHLEAMGGRVFLNGNEIREAILDQRDLIELGEDGPRLRFRIHAERGEVCKPLRRMLHEAEEFRQQRGLARAARVFTRDFLFRSSWQVRVVTPLILATGVLVAAFFGGYLASSSGAKEAEEARRLTEEQRSRELESLRTYVGQLEARQREMVDRKEVERIRGELDRQGELVTEALSDDRALAEVLSQYSDSVCLIHGIYGFRREQDGQQVPVTLPNGDPLEVEYTGSGFLAMEGGRILTNRHVAEPWWQNEEVAPFLGMGFQPEFRRLDVYFPGREAIAVDSATIVISSEGVDLAVMTADIEGVTPTPLEEDPLEDFRGRRIVLLGYPTGVGALLARSERDDLESIFAAASDLGSIIAELAKRGSVSPIITQGALNEVKEKRLVYDAATTSGGSGGPVFDAAGKVIGVNFAITRDFDGSNFGVPITFAKELLQP